MYDWFMRTIFGFDLKSFDIKILRENVKLSLERFIINGGSKKRVNFNGM